MPKHTPAPWIVDECNTPNGVGYFINHLWEDGYDEDGPVTRTDEIAEVCMDYADPEVPLKNARILAAAPDLLAACNAAKLQIRHDDDCAFVTREIGSGIGCSCGAARAAELVRKAIRKATHGSQETEGL